jgi:CheY-like chemotaxis protein
MLRLVTSNNGEVFRLLGSAPFRRLTFQHQVETEAKDLLALVRRVVPDLVLLDAQLEGESGFAVCRQIKDDPALVRTHVILLLNQIISRPELDGVESSRCDDVLALPISSEDFYHHIAQVAGLPLRRTPRVGIELSVMLSDRVEQTRGVVMNASQKGLGVRLGRALEAGQNITARIKHGNTQCDLVGRVAWCRPDEDSDQGSIAGIELTDDIPIRTRLLLEQLSLFEVLPSSGDDELGGAVSVVVQGDITEAIDLGPLAARLRGEQRIVFDMAGVRYVSSAGVKVWSDLISTLQGKEYAFRHCSIAFASQAAMVPMVIGTGRVLSLEAPYHCETCDRDDLRLLETRALLLEGSDITPPALRCVTCGGELEFDDLPNRYFAFLREDGHLTQARDVDSQSGGTGDPPRNP